MFSKPFVVAATLALATSVAPRQVFAQAASKSVASPDEERRRALYQDGKAAIKAQRWVDAKTALEQAWAISPSYDVALLLAQAEMNLGHYSEGARLLAYYFRNVSAKETEKTYNNAKQAFELAKQKVSAVTVTAPAASEVWVDGKPIGTAPLEGVVYVNPGKHVFEARRGGVRDWQPLDAVAGQDQAISLSLQDAAPASAEPSARSEASVSAGLPEPAPQAKPTTPSDRPSYVPPAIAATVGGVALVSGIAFFVVASGKSSDREDLAGKLGDSNACGGSSPPSSCKRIADLSDQAAVYRGLGYTSLGVGVAAGVATYLLWPSAEQATRDRVTLTPLLSGDRNSLTVGATGRF